MIRDFLKYTRNNDVLLFKTQRHTGVKYMIRRRMIFELKSWSVLRFYFQPLLTSITLVRKWQALLMIPGYKNFVCSFLP